MSEDCKLQEIQVLFLDKQVKAQLQKLKNIPSEKFISHLKVFGSSRSSLFPKKGSLLRNLSDGRSHNKGPCIVARFTHLSYFPVSNLMVPCMVGLAPPRLLLVCFVLTAKGTKGIPGPLAL